MTDSVSSQSTGKFAGKFSGKPSGKHTGKLPDKTATSFEGASAASASHGSGIKSQGHFSIVRQLLLLLLVPLILIISIAAFLSIATASRSVNQVYDQQMQSSAEILLAFLHYEMDEHSEDEEDHHDEDDDEDLGDDLVEVVANIESQHGFSVNYRMSVDSQTIFTSGLVRYFPECAAGFQNFSFSDSQQAESDWRCYSRTQQLRSSDVPIKVEFYELVQQRRDAISTILVSTFIPMLLLPFVVLLVTLWVVWKVKKSLNKMTHAVGLRSVDNLERIPRDDQPREFLPVVDSVNQLLSGVERGVIREKQFTDDAAHELRTPLTSIKMLEQLLRRENSNPMLLPYLDSLQSSVERSENLTEQLLVLARVQTTQSLEKENINLKELLHSLLGLLSPQLTAKSLSVEFRNELDSKESEQSWQVYANRAGLELLINNLLTNAIKFSPEAGGLYFLMYKDRLKIEDDGPGIKLEDRDFVFDRFYRGAMPDDMHRDVLQGMPSSKALGDTVEAQKSTTDESFQRTPKSTGLGLALAKSVAEAHGFLLTVETSSAGKGASFLLVFKAAESD